MIQKLFSVLLIICSIFLCIGCAKKPTEQTTIKFAAAASLEKMFEQRLIPMYKKHNPQTKLEGTYGGSGALQVQIEQGLDVDIFISASNKQMQKLKTKQLVASENPLLRNDLVLIAPKNSKTTITNFSDFTNAEHPAIGDYKYVPAGQYAKEALTRLGIWHNIASRVSMGSNVVEVLNWVAQGNADAGIVYATDAASNKNVKILAKLSPDLLKEPIIYPLGILKKNSSKSDVHKFVDFLQSQEAQTVYKEFGFGIIK